ncbi:SDR family NAD(P)-dependent oxidoreductase [Saccharopolyspora sp. NPDC002578]
MDGARVVVVRSRLVGECLAGSGGMISIAEPLAELRSRLARFGARVEVAAVNGPRSGVVSGDPAVLVELLAECEDAGVRARRIPVDYASHTAQVESIRQELVSALSEITPKAPDIPFYSTVDGDWVRDASLDGEYWYRNLRHQVGFHDATESLLDEGFRCFVEVSPHPVLTTSVQDALEERGGESVVVGTLRRDDGGLRRLLTSMAELHVRGVPVDWSALFGGTGVRPVPLPTYAFQRSRYWLTEAEPPAADGPGPDERESRFWDAVERRDLDVLAATLPIGDPAERSALTTVLPALARWRERSRRLATMDSWRYRIEWKPVVADGSELAGTWLVAVPASCADDESVMAVLRGLGDHGARVETLVVDAEVERDALAARVREVDAAAVVSLLALETAAHRDLRPLTTGLAGTVQLVQALGDAGSSAPLWCLTRGAVAVAVAQESAVPEQSAVWGLGRVVALEHPGRWGGLVDLPADVDAAVVRHLVGVLAGAEEDQVAIRAAGVLARRLVPAPLPDTRPVRTWTPRGTVLITGGTGGVAAHLARWLAGNGAERIVLTSRRGPAAEGAAELVAELGELGAAAEVAACDVADRDAMVRLLAEIGPPTAVVHAAGVAWPCAVQDTGLAEFTEVLAGKVAGAANLDELLGDLRLDAFVLFSSNAATWGSGTQGAYAAANAYLDGVAQHRRARGLTATSVAWGAWDGGGMSTFSGDVRDRLLRSGLRFMPPDLAVAGLVRAVEHDDTCVTISDLDWPRFVPRFTAMRPSPLLADLPEVRAMMGETLPGTGIPESAPGDLVRRLSPLSADDRRREVLELVRSEAAAVLGHGVTSAVPSDRAFNEIGFDSLTAVELRNRLTAATGVRLPPTVVFDHPNPAALAAHLQGALDLGCATDGGALPAELEALEAAMATPAADESTREQVSARLRALLARWDSTSGPAGLDVEHATDDELFDFIDSEFGTS